MKRFGLYLLLIPCLLFCTCKKTPPEPPCPTHTDTHTLPPLTQCGANNFGCLLNGEVWVPEVKQSISDMQIQRVHCEYDKGFFIIKGTKRLKDIGIYESVLVYTSTIIDSIGTYSISSYDIDKSTGQLNDFMTGEKYETQSLNSGELKITKLDRENFIISGTFWFTAVNDQGDTIRVTDGRFDVRE